MRDARVILSYLLISISKNSQLGFRYEIVRLEKGFSGPAQPNRSPCFQNWLKGKIKGRKKTSVCH
jgi:hypothetical protein